MTKLVEVELVEEIKVEVPVEPKIKKKKVYKNNYFAKPEETHVKNFLMIPKDDHEARKLYFQNHLYKPFRKLSENIINTYGNFHGFFNMGIETKELKAICMAYIFDSIDKFDPLRRTKTNQLPKAYSFFGTIIKRHLIGLSKKSQQKYRHHIDLNDGNVYINYMEHEDLHYSDEYFNDNHIFINKITEWYEENHLKIGIKIQKEIDIMNAVLHILNKSENVENANKKQLYIYIREMTGHETKNITPTLKKMKTAYVHLRQNYINKGEIISGSVTI